MTYVDDKGNLFTYGDRVNWTVTVYDTRIDERINLDNPLVMRTELLLTQSEDGKPIFVDAKSLSWYWENLRKIDAYAFNVSIIKM